MILYPGTMLQDRYEILEKIGSGGMSEVYKAKCHKLNRLVAIKVLKSEFTSDATFVSKFKMEAQAAAGLSHPNIVNIYDVVDEGDIHFIVMELVEGITLKSYITKKGHLDVKEAIGIAIQVASGIEAAHEQHIIHRDIKPQNMLISMDGKVKVADFGIARAVSSQTMNAATVVGSVHYISPEQARGGYSDERSDLYSLGITMFEMVTGHVPFEGDNTVTVALAHLEEPMPDPRMLNPDVSPSLARIILKCTEKRPERRYPNAAAVISDLRRALLNDDDPTIGAVKEEDHSSDTIVISPKELNLIKTRSGERIRESKPVKEIRERRERRDLEKRYDQTDNAKKEPKKNKVDDEATGLEKILTGLGVAAAIVIVAVVIVFVLKLGGLFRSSTPEDPTKTVSEEAMTEEAKTTAASETVISQKEVSEYVPLSRASDGSIVTQFTMTTLEELGLLKMDFLGLRTLTVIQNAVKLIQKDAGVTLDMQKINYDDKKVLDSLGTGRSDGVFQLESAGMKNFMKELKPQSLEDVIAGISLYRPGPMDFIPQYIRGKNRPDTIRYDCPQLEPILKPTYGCIVYQEQVMQIVRNLAGYTLGRSDLVRRAMSKKKASVMEKERQNFVYGNEAEGVPGCIANGIDEATANKIYDEMIDFAKYAFNKSHAAAYAVVSYQTAYLKYYYPVEFMAALMTSVIDFPNKVAEYILVCRQMGIKILPPDVNCGMYGFSVDNGAIRYGLSAIKSVGRPVIESLVKERDENGQYRSLKDFMERNSPQMNKRAVENFIKAGALDCLDGNRRQKMLVYQKISDSISQDKKNSLAGQMSLFDLVSEEDKKEFEIRMPDVEEFGKEELLGYEKEVLGIYLSGHPLENYRGMMEKTISAKTSDFQQDEETNLPKVTDGQKVIIGGMITDKTIKYTKNNKVMAFLTVEDLVGTVEVVVFPRDYEKSQQFLNEEGRVFIQGRVSAEDDRASKLILEKIRPFDNMPREIWIQFDNKESYTQQSQELLADLRRSPGDSAVVIYLKDVKAIKKLPVGYHAQIQDSWLNYMYEKYGKTNVKVVERGLKNL